MRPLISAIRQTAAVGSRASVDGWVQSVRKMKNVAFADIGDGSSVHSLNVVFDRPEQAAELSTGACVQVDGQIVESPGKQKFELQADSVKVLGPAGPDYPLQKKYHSREFLRQLPHLRWKTRQAAQVLRYRSWAMAQLQQFFIKNDVCQVNSPIITSSDCEGAGEVFTIEKSQEFFGKPAYLSVSSQLHLEVFAASLSRVWNMTPAFRAEASDTNRHLSEFWIAEVELAFISKLEELTKFCEHMTQATVPADAMREELLVSKRDGETRAKLENRWNIVSKPWTTLTYTEAVDLLNKSGKVPPLVWGQQLPSEHEKFLASELVNGITVVTDYPESFKPFYMKASEHQEPGKPTVACFDVLFPEIGEVVGGSMREDSYELLKRRMALKNMNSAGLEWYTDLRKFGSFPHGGYGLGFERLVMYLCGLDNVRDATGFVRGFGQLPC